MRAWKGFICAMLGAVSICARAPDLSRRCVVIEQVEGLIPAETNENLNLNHATGTSLKVGREYTLALKIKFIAPVKDFVIRFSTYSGNGDSCVLNYVSDVKPEYDLGTQEVITCRFTPRLSCTDIFRVSPLEEHSVNNIDIIKAWALFPIVIRPAMDLRCMTSLEGVSMATREGWLTLAVGALAFVGLAWRRASLRKWKGWAWLAGWIGVTFLGQMGVWFLMDKLFLSYPERVFTPFDHFNLPAILSAMITLTAGWFALRKQGGGKVNSIQGM